MNKYGLHGCLRAAQGKGDELVSILLQASKIVAMAKGCHLYMVSQDTNNLDSVWITEVWDSKDDHDNSLHIEGVKELIARALPILDGQPEKGLEMNVLGGLGIH